MNKPALFDETAGCLSLNPRTNMQCFYLYYDVLLFMGFCTRSSPHGNAGRSMIHRRSEFDSVHGNNLADDRYHHHRRRRGTRSRKIDENIKCIDLVGGCFPYLCRRRSIDAAQWRGDAHICARLRHVSICMQFCFFG